MREHYQNIGLATNVAGCRRISPDRICSLADYGPLAEWRLSYDSWDFLPFG
jgi:hypothetical protein